MNFSFFFFFSLWLFKNFLVLEVIEWSLYIYIICRVERMSYIWEFEKSKL